MKPSKKETIKLITAIIVTIIAILLAIWIPTFTAGWVNNIVTIITILSTLWLWLLNNSRIVFLNWSSLKMHFSSDTVAWEAVNKFDVKKELNFSKVCENYLNSLKKEYDALIKVSIEKKNHFEFEIIQGKKIRRMKLEFNEKESTNQINLRENASMSYRDSKKEYEIFLDLSEILKKKISVDEDEDDTYSIKEYYCVSLAFNKLNPFYHLIVRHADDVKVTDFNLNLEAEDLKIRIKEKQMTLISEKKKNINEALEKYIAISKI